MRDAACTRGSGLRDGIELGSQAGEGGRGEALPCGTSLIASPIAAPTEPKMGCGWSRGVPDMGLSPQGGTGCPAEPCCLVGTGRTELQGSGGGTDRGWVVGVPPEQPSTGKRCAPASEQGRRQRSLCGGFGLSLPAPALSSHFAWV